MKKGNNRSSPLSAKGEERSASAASPGELTLKAKYHHANHSPPQSLFPHLQICTSAYLQINKTMPEGPILLMLKDELQPFKNKKVIAAKGYTTKMDPQVLVGKTITDIKTWGKHLLICFPNFTVRVHLMLFGSYKINEHGKNNATLHLQFTKGEVNFYISSVILIDKPLDKVYDWSADVMSGAWSTEKAIEKLRAKPKTLIGDALLDQKIFSGVGNIIRNEALFRARLHPKSIIGDIPDKKLKEVTDEAVKYSFAFLKWKKKGVLTKHFEAYEQEMCPRDHIPFHKADIGKTKRHTYYCDKCEVLYDGNH